MLLGRSFKEGAEFVCDRCNKGMKSDDRYGIYIQEHKENLKKGWDLCGNSFRALKRGIAKGRK